MDRNRLPVSRPQGSDAAPPLLTGPPAWAEEPWCPYARELVLSGDAPPVRFRPRPPPSHEPERRGLSLQGSARRGGRRRGTRSKKSLTVASASRRGVARCWPLAARGPGEPTSLCPGGGRSPVVHAGGARARPPTSSARDPQAALRHRASAPGRGHPRPQDGAQTPLLRSRG